MGYFCNFRVPGFYSGRVSGWVSDFFNKTRTRLKPASGFFFFYPYPTLFLIEPGKTQPIRDGPSRVPGGLSKNCHPYFKE